MVMRILTLIVLFFCLSAAARADGPPLHPTDVREALGVNIHFTEPRPGEMAMLQRTGLGWVRMDFSWEATERQRGVYDFHAYDGLLIPLRRSHMRALFILDYGNPLYTGALSPRDDASRQAFAHWAAAAVTHFAGQGILWEMYNEPNGGFWKPKPNADEYAKLALAVGKAIHDAEPREVYIGPATSGIDLGFLKTCFQAGLLQYWAGVSVHPYRQSGPETAGPDYAGLRALIAQYAPPGKTISILSGEWGYSTSWGLSDGRQGDDLAREFLFNLASGIPLSIWYDWHDDGPDPKNGEHNFGTVRADYHAGRDPVYDPKPAYTAAATLTRLLGACRFERALPLGIPRQDFVLAFTEKSGRRRFAAWTTADAPRPLILPLPPGAYAVVDEVGRFLRRVTVGANGLPLTLTGAPQYVIPGR